MAFKVRPARGVCVEIVPMRLVWEKSKRFAPHGASELKSTLRSASARAVGFAPHGASELKCNTSTAHRKPGRFAPHGASELKSEVQAEPK